MKNLETIKSIDTIDYQIGLYETFNGYIVGYQDHDGQNLRHTRVSDLNLALQIFEIYVEESEGL